MNAFAKLKGAAPMWKNRWVHEVLQNESHTTWPSRCGFRPALGWKVTTARPVDCPKCLKAAAKVATS